jgi:hypothetical protein
MKWILDEKPCHLRCSDRDIVPLYKMVAVLLRSFLNPSTTLSTNITNTHLYDILTIAT